MLVQSFVSLQASGRCTDYAFSRWCFTGVHLISSATSTSPVGSFHMPFPRSGPVRSCTMSTSRRSFITKAPMPTWVPHLSQLLLRGSMNTVRTEVTQPLLRLPSREITRLRQWQHCCVANMHTDRCPAARGCARGVTCCLPRITTKHNYSHKTSKRCMLVWWSEVR